jgi:hypothetical protein
MYKIYIVIYKMDMSDNNSPSASLIFNDMLHSSIAVTTSAIDKISKEREEFIAPSDAVPPRAWGSELPPINENIRETDMDTAAEFTRATEERTTTPLIFNTEALPVTTVARGDNSDIDDALKRLLAERNAFVVQHKRELDEKLSIAETTVVTPSAFKRILRAILRVFICCKKNRATTTDKSS